MEEKKFINLYRTLPSYFQKEFEKWLVNNHTKEKGGGLKSAVKIFFTLKPNIDSSLESIKEEDIWKKCFPNKPFKAVTMRGYFVELSKFLDNYLIFECLSNENASRLLNIEGQQNINSRSKSRFEIKRYELLAEIYKKLGKLELYDTLLDNYQGDRRQNLADESYRFYTIKMSYQIAIKDQAIQFPTELKKAYYNSFFQDTIDETLFIIIKALIDGDTEFTSFIIKPFIEIAKMFYETNKKEGIGLYLEIYNLIENKNADWEVYSNLLKKLSTEKSYFHLERIADIMWLLLNFITILYVTHLKEITEQKEKRNDVIYIELYALIIHFILENELYYASNTIPFRNLEVLIDTVWKYKGLGKKELDFSANIALILTHFKQVFGKEKLPTSFQVLELMYFWSSKNFQQLEKTIKKAIISFKQNKEIKELPVFYLIHIKYLYLDGDFMSKEIEPKLNKIEEIISSDENKSTLRIVLFEYEITIWRFILDLLNGKKNLNNEEDKKSYNAFLVELAPKSPTFYYDKLWYYNELKKLSGSKIN